LADGVGCAVAVLEGPGEFVGEGGVAEAEEVGGSGAAGVFPFAFSGEAVAVTGLEAAAFGFATGEFGAVSEGFGEF
jgi:hypothetical protein